MNTKYKQVIVIRKDLKMRRGKEIAQGAHASMAFLTSRLRKSFEEYNQMIHPTIYVPTEKYEIYINQREKTWILGNFVKVCLRTTSEQDLLVIRDNALEAGLECHLITDSGLTEFKGVPTNTCLAIGPDESEKIDAITGHLELY